MADTKQMAESEPPSPEGEQLLQLIRQDFFLLRCAIDHTAIPLVQHLNEEMRPSGDEPTTYEEVDKLVGTLLEGVNAQIEHIYELAGRVESEVKRLAEAFIERAGPEGVRAQGYRRIFGDGQGDWEGPLIAERENPFGGDYWGERIAIKDQPASVRVDGVQYILEGEHDHLPGFKGHGGADFYIQFEDGRLAHTTNLWLNGPIPEEHKEQLHDNAAFLEKSAYDQAVLQRAKAGDVEPPPSLTEAILSNPHAFQPEGNGKDDGHDKGPDRGR
jgi:hypothetical protein